MRIQFYDTISQVAPDGAMIALTGVNVTVYNRGLSTRPNIWAENSDTSPIPGSTFVTVDGVLDFWVDPGSYELHFEDTVSPARVDPSFKITWEALPASDNTIPGAKLEDVSIDEDKLAQIVGSSFAQALINKLFAPGDLKKSYQPADHAGWLLCNGRNNLLVSDYPALGAMMQARGFLGIDVNHFMVPDFQGRMPIGMGTNPEVDALTDNDGEIVGNRRARHKHGVAQTPHSHPGFDLGLLFHSGASTGNQFRDGGVITDTRNVGFDAGTGDANAALSVGPQLNAPTDGPGFQVVNFFIKS